MAEELLCKKNTAYTYEIGLVDTSDTNSFKPSPTIAAGDFKISKDGGAEANLATLPTVSNSTVTIALSADETNCDRFTITGIDQTATKEWGDYKQHFKTATRRLDEYATQASVDTIDGIADDIKAVTENLPNSGSLTDLATLVSRVTEPRAGYWDNLNVGGNVASQADVQGILQNIRVAVSVPPQMERPDSGSTTYRIWIYAYNEQHLNEDLDEFPTVTAEDGQGNDRSGNLGSVVKPLGTSGQYYVDYTVSDSHEIDSLVIKVSAVEDTVSSTYIAGSHIVDTTAVDFSAADRAKLDTLHDTRLTGPRADKLDSLTFTTPNRINAQVYGLEGSVIQEGSFANGAITDLAIAPNAVTSEKIENGALNGKGDWLLASVWNTVMAGITSLAQWLGLLGAKHTGNTTARNEINATGAGSGTYDETNHSLEAQADSGGGGTGTGARTVTPTVTNGTDPLQNATIRYTEQGAPANTWSSQTDVNGQVVSFNLDDATYDVAITKGGHTFAGTTLVVDGDKTPPPYVMTPIAIAPSGVPGTVTAFLATVNESGPVADQLVKATLVKPPPGDGNAFLQTEASGRTDGSGLFLFLAFENATYEITIGDKTVCVEIPEGAADPFEITPGFLVCTRSC